MTLSELRSFLRRITATDSTSYSDTNANTDLNIAYGEVVLDILDSIKDINFNGEIAKTDLLSTVGLVDGDNGYNGEYSFPSDLIRPVRVEVSYDGSVWRPAKIYDIVENKSLSEHNDDDTKGMGTKATPLVRFYRNSFFIRPTKTDSGDIAGGIIIEYEKRQTELTADTDEPIIESNLHQLIAYKASEIYLPMHPTESNIARLRMNEKKVFELGLKLKKLYTKKTYREKKMTTKNVNYK